MNILVKGVENPVIKVVPNDTYKLDGSRNTTTCKSFLIRATILRKEDTFSNINGRKPDFRTVPVIL